MAELTQEPEVPIIEDVTEEEERAIRRDALPQKDYYNKWESFAREEDDRLKEEDEEAKLESDRALGKSKYATSEAHKKDMETHEKLKAAKKLLDRRIGEDEAAKFTYENKVGDNLVFQAKDMDNKRVLVIKNCKDSVFELPSTLLGLIKVFVEGCSKCSIAIGSKLITSHVELSHCEDCTLQIKDNELHTLQADLCNGITIKYDPGLFGERHRVYSAGTRDMTVLAEGGKLSTHADFIRDLAPVVMHGEERNAQDPRAEEQHFITRLVDGALVTEVAIQVGDRFVTRSELDMENATQAQLTHRLTAEMNERAERDKAAGNQSFANAEYAQAAVHYTSAIDHAQNAAEQGDPIPILHACYSNRAACFLKLGQPERALQDANLCIATKPDFVKGHFRKGMALHAMGLYRDALPCFGKALSLENPKNKQSVRQIKEAITFAEVKMQKTMRSALS